MVAQLLKSSLCCSCPRCHVRGEGSGSNVIVPLCYYPKWGAQQKPCSCAPTAGCSWQGPVKNSVSSFSFLFSLTHRLAALTVALKSSPFDFQAAKILSNPDKEAFDWVAVNYVLENFFKVKDSPAWGVQN